MSQRLMCQDVQRSKSLRLPRIKVTLTSSQTTLSFPELPPTQLSRTQILGAFRRLERTDVVADRLRL